MNEESNIVTISTYDAPSDIHSSYTGIIVYEDSNIVCIRASGDVYKLYRTEITNIENGS